VYGMNAACVWGVGGGVGGGGGGQRSSSREREMQLPGVWHAGGEVARE
jgi:hypothetical protein